MQSAPSGEASATTPATGAQLDPHQRRRRRLHDPGRRHVRRRRQLHRRQHVPDDQADLRHDRPGLYQNERWGDFTYAIPVANGTYDLRLHFAELYFGSSVPGGAGKRVFGFDVVDTTANPDLPNIDIFATVGANAALVKTIPGVRITDGTLNLRSVRGVADDPEITAIEVIPAAPAGPPTVTQTTPANGATGIVSTVRADRHVLA